MPNLAVPCQVQTSVPNGDKVFWVKKYNEKKQYKGHTCSLYCWSADWGPVKPSYKKGRGFVLVKPIRHDHPMSFVSLPNGAAVWIETDSIVEIPNTVMVL